MIIKVAQTCHALWFIFFVPPVSHESMRMAWFLFGPKCRVWCLFGGAQSIKHKPPVKTQDLCKFSVWCKNMLCAKESYVQVLWISGGWSCYVAITDVPRPWVDLSFKAFSSANQALARESCALFVNNSCSSQIEAHTRGNRNPCSATAEATLPEKTYGLLARECLSPVKSRIFELSLFSTELLTRKFSN